MEYAVESLFYVGANFHGLSNFTGSLGLNFVDFFEPTLNMLNFIVITFPGWYLNGM